VMGCKSMRTRRSIAAVFRVTCSCFICSSGAGTRGVKAFSARRHRRHAGMHRTSGTPRHPLSSRRRRGRVRWRCRWRPQSRARAQPLMRSHAAPWRRAGGTPGLMQRETPLRHRREQHRCRGIGRHARPAVIRWCDPVTAHAGRWRGPCRPTGARALATAVRSAHRRHQEHGDCVRDRTQLPEGRHASTGSGSWAASPSIGSCAETGARPRDPASGTTPCGCCGPPGASRAGVFWCGECYERWGDKNPP
jgi:hypothetical protein